MSDGDDTTAEIQADVARLREENARLCAALAEHEDDDGTDLTSHYRAECERMRAVVEAACAYVEDGNETDPECETCKPLIATVRTYRSATEGGTACSKSGFRSAGKP